MCYNSRSDVVYFKNMLPRGAPPEFSDPQRLSDEVNKAEKRYDARTAKLIIASLPKELSTEEHIKVVDEFVQTNFVDQGFVAVVAIHSGINESDPQKNNPHAHILVSTRTLDANGFSRIKPREMNQKERVTEWRKQWENVLNRALERNNLEIRVSCKSLEVQGIKREPMPHLTLADYQKEKRGERTLAGDKKREIMKLNDGKFPVKHRKDKELDLSPDLSR